MNKHLFFLSMLCFGSLAFSQAQEKQVQISGRIAGLGNQEIRILDPLTGELGKTNAQQDSFSFKLNMMTHDQRFYTLHVPSLGDLGPSMKIPALYFMVADAPIVVHAHIEDGSLKEDNLKGATPLEDFNKTYQKLGSTQALNAVTQQYNEAFHAYNMVEQSDKNRAALTAVGERIDSIYKVQRSEIFDLIKANPNSLTIATLASQYCPPEGNAASIRSFLENFSPQLQEKSFYLQQFKQQLKQYTQLEVGQQAPEFSITGVNNEPIKLSQFKGKYVLLDFWASWCGPCRREMPHVKAAYEQFQDKNFTVFAVSIDQDQAAWKKAMEEDKMPFVHALDQRGKKSVSDMYMVRAIPTNFLIDTKGRIIAKNLRGEELAKFLAAELK